MQGLAALAPEHWGVAAAATLPPLPALPLLRPSHRAALPPLLLATATGWPAAGGTALQVVAPLPPTLAIMAAGCRCLDVLNGCRKMPQCCDEGPACSLACSEPSP